MIAAMGIIRPATASALDRGDRWALALDTDPDALLIGTRATVLAFSERLTNERVRHLVYRRPSSVADWQLIQSAVTP